MQGSEGSHTNFPSDRALAETSCSLGSHRLKGFEEEEHLVTGRELGIPGAWNLWHKVSQLSVGLQACHAMGPLTARDIPVVSREEI